MGFNSVLDALLWNPFFFSCFFISPFIFPFRFILDWRLRLTFGRRIACCALHLGSTESMNSEPMLTFFVLGEPSLAWVKTV